MATNGIIGGALEEQLNQTKGALDAAANEQATEGLNAQPYSTPDTVGGQSKPLRVPATSKPAPQTLGALQQPDTGIINGSMGVTGNEEEPPPELNAQNREIWYRTRGLTPPAPNPAQGATLAPANPNLGQRTMVAPTAVKEPVKSVASQIGATSMNIDPTTMTVQGQLDALLKADNPLMTQARANALKEANKRGLINSTMAAQAGEQALISQALPIAQADSAAYLQVGARNQDATNTFSLRDKDFENTQNLEDFRQQSQRAAQTEGSNLRLTEQEQQFQNSNSMFERDNDLKERLTMAGIRSNEQISAQQAAGQMAAASAQREVAMAGIRSQELQNEAQRAFQREAMNFDAQTRTTLTQMESDARYRMHLDALGANAYSNYTQQFTSIATADMDGDDKDRQINNLGSLYNGNPWMPVIITPGAGYKPKPPGPPPPPPPPDPTGD
jgi:hypothetical protein